MTKTKMYYSWNKIEDIAGFGMQEYIRDVSYKTLADVKKALINKLWINQSPSFRPVWSHKNKIMNLRKLDFEEGKIVDFAGDGFSLRLKMVVID